MKFVVYKIIEILDNISVYDIFYNIKYYKKYHRFISVIFN